MQSCVLRVLLTQWSIHTYCRERIQEPRIRRWQWVGGCTPLRTPSPPSPAQAPWRPGPAHRHPAPRHPLLPPAGQASITAPERPPSRLLRAPPLSSLGLPHLHSPGSPLLDKVTSAHSGARGFHRGGSHRRPPGQGGARGREPGRPGGGPVRELQNSGRLAGPGTARKAWWRRGGGTRVGFERTTSGPQRGGTRT